MAEYVLDFELLEDFSNFSSRFVRNFEAGLSGAGCISPAGLGLHRGANSAPTRAWGLARGS